MLKKIAFSLGLSTVLIVGSYYWGYLCGKREADLASFDRILVYLFQQYFGA